jgi:hypothetical protein
LPDAVAQWKGVENVRSERLYRASDTTRAAPRCGPSTTTIAPVCTRL